MRANNVQINPEGSGYYSIDVEVPIQYDNPRPANAEMLLCNNVIEVKLNCKGKYISYDAGSKVTCEIVSNNGMNIVVVVDNAGQNNIISIPYSESFIHDMIGGDSIVKRNDISVKGERNTNITGTNSWDFKFNLKEILGRKSGDLKTLIKKFNVSNRKIISTFVSFVEANSFILKFKNIRVVTDNIPENAININFSVKNDTNVSSSLTYRDLVLQMLTEPKLNLNITNIPNADTPISEKFSGDELIVSNFLKKCAITSNGGIIDIKLVQLIFIFFYIIIQDPVRTAKISYQNVSVITSSIDMESSAKQLFKQFYNNRTFFNFLSFVYMSISNISNPKDLSFKNIFNNMRQIASQYSDLKADLIFKTIGKQYGDQGGGGILAGGAIGDEDDNSDSFFKNISRIIPMQITDFNTSPQNMIVTITIPHVIEELTPVSGSKNSDQELGDDDDNSSVASDDSNGSANELSDADNSLEQIEKILNSKYKKTQDFIEESLTKGEIKVQVGDCVQFVDGNGKTIKAIICFFKSGKYTYNNAIRYESASNMVDYYNSMKQSTIQNVINEKESEPLNLISLLNLRGFAFLPYEAVPGNYSKTPTDELHAAERPEDNLNYTILYDCKSDISRLHNGYNPSDKISKGLKEIGKALIPISTEFVVGSVGALQFNTASYMTLKKIDNRPKIFDKFREFLQSLDMADEKTITRSIQTYIQQYGLSKLCGKMASPDDVNRMNLFKQKVMNVDNEFIAADVFNMKVNQYNVYKSNIFIQGLLNEKISDEDSVALFQSKYEESVPELIYWFFTSFARSNPTRAMIMVFQAFAHNSTEEGDGEFHIDLLETLPGDTNPSDAAFAGGQAGGTMPSSKGVSTDAVKAEKAGAAELEKAGAAELEEAGAAELEEADTAEEEEVENSGGTATSADPISIYIKRLIDIVKINGLYDPQYLNALMSALKAAKIKYKSKSETDKRLFSASTADPERAEAAMQAHINNADKAAKTAAEAAKQAKADAEKKSKADDELRHQRQVELAKASSGAMSKGKGAFDLSSLLKSRDGNDINNQLGTCISGNNIVVSCDGQTVRIDLDLATLLSTCADSFTLSGLNSDVAKIPGSNNGDDDDDDDVDDVDVEDADGNIQGNVEQQVADGDEEAAAGVSGNKGPTKSAGSIVKKTGATTTTTPVAPLAAPPAAAIPTIESVKKKYEEYDTDYKKFKDDPVYKYLDYDAKYDEFIKSEVVRGLTAGHDV